MRHTISSASVPDRQFPRRPLRVAQPESTAALRPCQARAEARRAAMLERDRARDWLRRLGR